MTKQKIKIAGFCSGHDCAYAVLENGVPLIHNELERFTREKEPIADSLQFLLDTFKSDDIKHFTHCFDTWSGGIQERYPKSFNSLSSIVQKNNGSYYVPGHHQSHAANAFFSSNLEEALIITIDGGGRDYDDNGDMVITTFTVWEGKGNKIHKIDIIPESKINIGVTWSDCTKNIFGLSSGYPKGNQAGTVMAMACMGDATKYFDVFYNSGLNGGKGLNFPILKKLADQSEQSKFDISAGLQKATEIAVKKIMDKYIKNYPYKNICLSGGVALNSVMVGKMFDWYPHLQSIYVDPVPYDAGLALGSARYVWHHILDNPRIKWEDNSSPYLGKTYNQKDITDAIEKFNSIKIKKVDDDQVIDLLSNGEGNVISVYGGGSESGRRALGNRSILADPRNKNMKDIINEKVKHRQWYRPFAPSILRDKVKDWFEKDIDSPYMSAVIKFKKEVRDLVPAVVHFDGSARLQTVTNNDNNWYYNFIKKFEQKTNVPILLNTSFNDQEPIVETPEHAINCFLKTNIDYLYFRDTQQLISKK